MLLKQVAVDSTCREDGWVTGTRREEEEVSCRDHMMMLSKAGVVAEEAREGSDEDIDIWEMTAHKMVKPKVAFDRSASPRLCS